MMMASRRRSVAVAPEPGAVLARGAARNETALASTTPSDALTAGAGPRPLRRLAEAEAVQPAHAAAGCAREQPFIGHGAFRSPGHSPSVLLGPRLPAHPEGPASPQLLTPSPPARPTEAPAALQRRLLHRRRILPHRSRNPLLRSLRQRRRA
jgi:hypothetical protein